MISHEQSEPMKSAVKKVPLSLQEERQRTRVLLFLLGIELPLLGGFWVWNNDPWYYLMFLSIPLGAALLRTWWALLIVPVLFAIGITLGILLFPLLQGGWPALQDRLNNGLEGVDILLVFGTPVIIGLAVLGTIVGVTLGKRK